VTGTFARFADALRAERPVAIATVIDGPNVGAKILVEPDRPAIGTLGDPELDRVVTRDVFPGDSFCSAT
jgi:xanthine dehydrogenase accessory factor